MYFAHIAGYGNPLAFATAWITLGQCCPLVNHTTVANNYAEMCAASDIYRLPEILLVPRWTYEVRRSWRHLVNHVAALDSNVVASTGLVDRHSNIP